MTAEADIDWELTHFEGARREQLRRWAQLPLEQIIAALEEMEELDAMLRCGASPQDAARPSSRR